MSTSFSSGLKLLWCMIIVSIAQDQYFNISTPSSVINGTINCNPTQGCYIRCLAPFSCQNTTITCNSALCDVQCTQESCFNTTVNILQSTNHSTVTLTCTGYSSCSKLTVNAETSFPEGITLFVLASTISDEKPALTAADINVKGFNTVQILNGNSTNNLRCDDNCLYNVYNLQDITFIKVLQKFNEASFIPQGFNIIDSQSINFTCVGQESCHGNMVNLTHRSNKVNSTIDIVCHGTSACQKLNVAVSIVDKLNMFCIEGNDVCSSATLSISPLFDHTHMICNGAADSGSCNDILLIVPYHPAFLFLHTIFVHEESDDSIPFAGSIDGVRMICSGDEMCTEWTPFPLLWDAVPDMSLNNVTFRYYGYYSYNYLFKKISCASGQSCFIDCKGPYTCSSTFIECNKGSKCDIECDGAYKCDNMVIKAYGDSVKLKCSADKACNEAQIWLPSSDDGLDISFISESSSQESLTDITFLCKDTGEIGRYVLNNAGSYVCDNDKCCHYGPGLIVKDKGKKGGNVGIIVAIACVIVLLLIGIGVVFVMNKRRKAQTEYMQMQDPLVNN